MYLPAASVAVNSIVGLSGGGLGAKYPARVRTMCPGSAVVMRDSPPAAIDLLVLWRVDDQVAVLDVFGQCVVHFPELNVS